MLNNSILGYQKHAEEVKFGAPHRRRATSTAVDHAAIARACGWHGVRGRGTAPGIGPALATALAAGEPALLDVMTDPDAYPPITLFEGRLPA